MAIENSNAVPNLDSELQALGEQLADVQEYLSGFEISHHGGDNREDYPGVLNIVSFDGRHNRSC